MIWNMSFKKVHHLFENGANFPQTLKRHFKFLAGVLVRVYIYIYLHIYIVVPLSQKCGIL